MIGPHCSILTRLCQPTRHGGVWMVVPRRSEAEPGCARIPKTHEGLRTAIFYTRLYNRSMRTGLAIIAPATTKSAFPMAKSTRAAEAAINTWYEHAKLQPKNLTQPLH